MHEDQWAQTAPTEAGPTANGQADGLPGQGAEDCNHVPDLDHVRLQEKAQETPEPLGAAYPSSAAAKE